jgi:NAD-dependent SIR2 family protein deacetylase
MKFKGRIVLFLVAAVLALAGFTTAKEAVKMPDKDLTIDSPVFKQKKKAPVVFSHTKHKEFKCVDCHHEYKDGKNVWQEGQEVKKCGACHELEAKDKIVKLEKAFHDQCQNCHKKLAKERGKEKSGPTACTKCHPAKPGEKEEPEKK